MVASSAPGAGPLGGPGFNPLHCGAVVASMKLDFASSCRSSFQSPSLRGSGRFRCRLGWFPSLPPRRFNPLHCGAVVASRTPRRRGVRRAVRFNPLHCGAVVASVLVIEHSLRTAGFQSPSLRGSGRFGATGLPAHPAGQPVSIPFIAGQWSLHVRMPENVGDFGVFQSPSLRGSGRFTSRLGGGSS